MQQVMIVPSYVAAVKDEDEKVRIPLLRGSVSGMQLSILSLSNIRQQSRRGRGK